VLYLSSLILLSFYLFYFYFILMSFLFYCNFFFFHYIVFYFSFYSVSFLQPLRAPMKAPSVAWWMLTRPTPVLIGLALWRFDHDFFGFFKSVCFLFWLFCVLVVCFVFNLLLFVLLAIFNVCLFPLYFYFLICSLLYYS
jgi:hypothetical protein